MSNSIPLEARQRAGQEVERRMTEFMLQFAPCEKLLVGDVIQIAAHSRRLAFDLFSGAYHSGGFDGPTGAD